MQILEEKFFEDLQQIVKIINTCRTLYYQGKEIRYLEQIKDNRNGFYLKVNQFRTYVDNGGRITRKDLDKLCEYREMDWTKEKTLEKIKFCLDNLKSVWVK